jgi:RHS repeat-associated protein
MVTKKVNGVVPLHGVYRVEANRFEPKWVQEFFWAKFGEAVVNELSPPASERLEIIDPTAYYQPRGIDGKGMSVPADLDDSICCYLGLPHPQRGKFDRACFWLDMAYRQWTDSFSASFASLVSVDSVFARIDSSGNLAWYLTDHLGSIRVVMNSADTTTDVVSFDTFGNIASESNATFGDRYKWTGREFDALTGFQYNRARDYSAGAGRWTSEDQLGFGAGDYNLYCYANNRPTDLVDPLGSEDQHAISGEGGYHLSDTTKDFEWSNTGRGNYRWVISWNVTGSPLKPGFIVQAVNNSRKVGYYRDNLDPRISERLSIFYEVFPVDINGTTFTCEVGDTWRFNSKGLARSGNILLRAAATFYAGLDFTTLKGLGFAKHPDLDEAPNALTYDCKGDINLMWSMNDRLNATGCVRSNNDVRSLRDLWVGRRTVVKAVDNQKIVNRTSEDDPYP